MEDHDRARAILEEEPYWIEILKLLQEQNVNIGNVADEMADAVVVLPALLFVADHTVHGVLAEVLESISKALEELVVVQEKLLDAVRIADGRQKYLRREVDSWKEEEE